MAFAGLRGTGDWGTDERPKNFRELILFQNPNGRAPMFALTSKGSKTSTDDPEFSWWEEIQGVIRVRANGALNDSATTLVLDANTASNAAVDANGIRGAGLDLVPGDLLMVETAAGVDATFTNEIVLVSAVASNTSITIVRGAAGSTAAAIADNSFLTKIGNAYAEGTRSPSVTSRNPRKLPTPVPATRRKTS
jgi:hypothetical protein